MSNTANLHDELLALLDNESRAGSLGSRSSLPTARQISKRHNRNQKKSSGSVGSGSDRSLPPRFKYWANHHTTFNRLQASDHCNTNSIRSGNTSDVSNSSSSKQRKRKTKSVTKVVQRWVKKHADQATYLGFITIGAYFFVYINKKIILTTNEYNLQVDSSSLSCPRHLGRRHRANYLLSSPQFTSFIDISWRGKEEVQYETLIPPSEIDFSIQRRLLDTKEQDCDDILLYLPRSNSDYPVRSSTPYDTMTELNHYLLASLLATYMGKAMVVIERPSVNYTKWEDCLNNREDNGANHDSIGLSHLIQHPKWLSRKCPVPCQQSYDHTKWNEVRQKHLQQVTCQNDNARQTSVFAVGSEDIDEYFEQDWKDQMLERPSPAAQEWALRLGATGKEAQIFGELTNAEHIWGYVSALMARSGVIRFQPWIANEVRELIKSSKLPLNCPYNAIYVHNDNDDKRVQSSTEEEEEENEGGESTEEDGVHETISLQSYLPLLNKAQCDNDPDKTLHAYVATNDPGILSNMLSNTITTHDGQDISFLFSPAMQWLDADVTTNCQDNHRVIVALIADLMILSKSDTYIGGFDSKVGGLVHIFRSAVNNYPGKSRDGPVLIRNAHERQYKFVEGSR